MLNRRKPEVVIPRSFDPLMSVASNVYAAIEDNPLASTGGDSEHPVAEDIFNFFENNIIDNANAANDSSIMLLEQSQLAVARRDVHMDVVFDGLVIARDNAFAIDGLSPGLLGFEVRQYRTRGVSRPRVFIPTNVDRRLALARRVLASVSQPVADPADPAGGLPADPNLAIIADLLDDLGFAAAIDSATDEYRDATSKREAAQVQIVARNAMADEIRLQLVRARDLGFAVAGPRNYDRVAELGFEVRSNATQNPSSNSDSIGDNEPGVGGNGSGTGGNGGSGDGTLVSESGDCAAMGISFVPESSDNFNVENSQIQWNNPTGADVVVSARIGQIPEGSSNGFVEWNFPFIVQPVSDSGYAEIDLAQAGGTFLYEWTVSFGGMTCVHTQRFDQ